MIIGLIGNKRVGKDTFADYLVEKYNFRKIAFADPIKNGVKILFDLSDEQLNGNLKEVIDKRWNRTPRQILQEIGTDYCRKNYGEDIWIKRMKYELSKSKDTNIVISDIRFPNEAEAVREMGGYLIKIIRNNIEISDKHISEQLIETISFNNSIKNDGTFQEYKNKIDKLISSI